MIKLNENRSERISYKFKDYPIFLEDRLLSSYPGYAAPSHFHEDLEFIYIKSGKMDYSVNGNTVTLEMGEGIFVNSRALHYGFSQKCEQCSFICLLIHPMLLSISGPFAETFLYPLINNAFLPFIHLKREVFWHESILDEILSINGRKGDKCLPAYIVSSALKILAILYDNLELRTDCTIREDNDVALMRKMLSYIERNYMQKISLEGIAESGGVGESKCCKLFARFLKQSPMAYLQSYRLGIGAHLLENSRISITDIALECGFSDSSYFAGCFRKWAGVSPKEYRRKKGGPSQKSDGLLLAR